jgi:hypothetical protein
MRLMTAIKIGEYKFELEKMVDIERTYFDNGLVGKEGEYLGYNVLFSHNREEAIELLSSINDENTTIFYGEEEVLLKDSKDDIILPNEEDIWLYHDEEDGHKLYKEIIGVEAKGSISSNLYTTLKMIEYAIEHKSAIVGSFPHKFNAREMRKVLDYICENNIQAIIYSDDTFLMDILPVDTTAMIDTNRKEVVYVGDYKGYKEMSSFAKAFFVGRFV